MPTRNPEPLVELEVAKVLVSPVVQRRVDGKVVGETVNDPVPLFSADEVKAFMAEVERQIADLNEQARQAKAAENRAARRGKK